MSVNITSHSSPPLACTSSLLDTFTRNVGLLKKKKKKTLQGHKQLMRHHKQHRRHKHFLLPFTHGTQYLRWTVILLRVNVPLYDLCPCHLTHGNCAQIGWVFKIDPFVKRWLWSLSFNCIYTQQSFNWLISFSRICGLVSKCVCQPQSEETTPLHTKLDNKTVV